MSLPSPFDAVIDSRATAIAKAKIAEAANRLQARARDFEVEAVCYAHEQDTAERHDRYMLIAEILGEVAGYLKDPL